MDRFPSSWSSCLTGQFWEKSQSATQDTCIVDEACGLLDIWLTHISVSAKPWKAPQNEHRCHHHVFATVGARDPLSLCVRRIHQSESVPVHLLYSVDLARADHRDRRYSTFLPS